MQDMARDLKDATNSSFNDAFRLIRTESAHVDGEVLLESFKQAKAELGYTKYIFDATIDNRTSEICAEKDNKSYYIDEAVIGENFPPLHPNCRSTVVLDENSIDESLIEESKQEEKEEETQEEFKPAESIEEAENYAKNNFVERDFLDKTFKGEVSYNGISLDNANKINKSLYNIYSKYDIKKISGIKSVSATNKAFKSGADAMGAYNIAQKGIFLNKDLLKNAKAFEQYQKKAEDAWNLVMNNLDKLDAEQRAIAEAYKKAGRSLVDDSLQGVITHEMGHHIEWQVLPTKLNNEIGATKSQFAPKISGYANASKSEYLAETFVAYMNGETKIINPEFKKYMNSLKK
jgi:SPP1 gp7 family putative phage head morphogenesis protein